jgi:membrane protein
MQTIKLFLKELAREWRRDEIMQRSAAIAYYAVFSLPALLLVVLSIASMTLDEETVNKELFGSMRQYVGDDSAILLQETISNVQQTNADSIWAALIAFILLLLAGSGIIRTLQKTVNKIINVEEVKKSWLMTGISYILSLILVLLTAGVLIGAVVSGAVINVLGEQISVLFSVSPEMLSLAQNLVTYIALTVLIFILYLFLPAKRFPLPIVILCSIITGSLLIMGTVLASYYVARSNPGEAYGAAASVIILLFWIYLAANLFLFGTEVMEVSARLLKAERTKKKSALRKLLRM